MNGTTTSGQLRCWLRRAWRDRALAEPVSSPGWIAYFPNVVITSHQGLLTREALAAIAETTLDNVSAFERGEPLHHEVRAEVGPPRR
jgi:lactate dehydrogenase-like 2-hydroxyacid dehydrogenase